MGGIRLQEWGHFFNEKKLDFSEAWYLNSTDFNHDEAAIDLGFEASSWNDLVQEERSLVPLCVTEFPSMEGDLMEVFQLQENPEEDMVFDEILADCSSNWVARHCNEMGADSKATECFSSVEEDLGEITTVLMVENGRDCDEILADCSSNKVQSYCNEMGADSMLKEQFSSGDEKLGDITEELMVEKGKNFSEILADCSSDWVQVQCSEMGADSKPSDRFSSGDEDLGDITDVLMVEKGKEMERQSRESEDEISVSDHCPAEAEEHSGGNKSMSSEAGNGNMSSSSSSSQSADFDWLNLCTDSAEYNGLRLVHLLTVCAEAISEGSHDVAEIILERLKELVSPSGSTMERVAYYLSQSLLHRHESSGPRVQSSQNPTKDPNFMGAFNLLNQVYPYIRFAHFTANQSILEAIPADQTQRLHILDFDIMEGMQWPPLMEALKAENYSIDHLKITAIKWSDDGSNPSCSQHTGRRLSDYASSFGIPFSFQETQLGNLEKNRIFRKDETVIVNSMWGLPHMLERSRRKLSEFLDAARHLNPTLLTLGSGPHGIQSYQDLNFVEIFEQCMRNICAVFDSLEAGLPEQYGLARAVVERLFMGPLMCRPIHYSQHKQDPFFSHSVIDVPIKCGFIQGDLSETNSIYAECMGNAERCYSVERLGQNQLLLRWQSIPLTSISVWKATDLM